MKKRGFTLIEIVVLVAIISLLAVVGTLKIKDRAEKNALITFKAKVPEFMRVATQRAFEEGQVYTIVVDTAGKTVKSKNGSGVVKETVYMPELLTYIIEDGADTELSVEIDDRGHGVLTGGGDLDKDVYVSNSKGEILYRVNLWSSTPVKYLKIRSFLPEMELNQTDGYGVYDIDSNWSEE